MTVRRFASQKKDGFGLKVGLHKAALEMGDCRGAWILRRLHRRKVVKMVFRVAELRGLFYICPSKKSTTKGDR